MARKKKKEEVIQETPVEEKVEETAVVEEEKVEETKVEDAKPSSFMSPASKTIKGGNLGGGHVSWVGSGAGATILSGSKSGRISSNSKVGTNNTAAAATSTADYSKIKTVFQAMYNLGYDDAKAGKPRYEVTLDDLGNLKM